MSFDSKMTAIADAIRAKTGQQGKLNLDKMAEAIAGISTGTGGGTGKKVTSVECITKGSNGNLLGDIDGNGILNDSDTEQLAALVMRGSYSKDYDFDGDGTLTNTDVITLGGLIERVEDGQILARVTVNYDDASSEFFYAIVDVPESGGGSGKTVTSVKCETRASSGNLFCDANGDGVVDDNDKTAFAKYLVYTGDIDVPACDLNGDGKADQVDQALMGRVIEDKEDGQAVAKVTVNYDSGSPDVFFVPFDMPGGVYRAVYTPTEDCSEITITHNLGTTDLQIATIMASELEGSPSTNFIWGKMWAKSNVNYQSATAAGYNVGFTYYVSSKYFTTTTITDSQYGVTITDKNTITFKPLGSGTIKWRGGQPYNVLIAAVK